MRLNHIYYMHLLNGEHKSITEETIRIVGKFEPVARQVQTQLDDVQACLDAENKALGRIAKNPYTKKLRQADQERDDTLRGLVHIVKGNCYHPDPTVREAANKLLEIPQLTPNIGNRGYEEEEALLQLLIRHLHNDYKQQADTLGLAQWTAKLEQQNQAVRQIHELAYAATASNKGISVHQARENTDQALKALANRMNALIETENPQTFEAFVSEYNVMVKYYETLLKERKTKNKHKQLNLVNADIASITDQMYTGDMLSPHPTVSYQGNILTANTDFTVMYDNNRNPGTAKVIVKGKGRYTGKIFTTFNIVREEQNG